MKLRYVIEIDVEPPPLAIREMLLNNKINWQPDPAVCSVCGSRERTQLLHFHLGNEYGYQQMTSCKKCRPAVDAEQKTIKTGRL